MASQFSSTFLDLNPLTSPSDLAILHLRRDNLIPTLLSLRDDTNSGYAEGKVSNTRFGSFPHSTLIGKPWGSQVRASAVDTGSRGRIPNLKRKRGNDQVAQEARDDGTTGEQHKEATEASSGFVHILTPTPERWTTSLPHRTQVVYTPDYSYILHRISARAGTRLIEAGAGSGSFTHAAVRAIFNGFPGVSALQDIETGKVFSYEFHTPRHEKMQYELNEHGLSHLVELTCRDVCKDGFVPSTMPASSIQATAVFLDLPAPWLALPHLSHTNPDSPLSKTHAVKICTFSPCVEQVQRTVTALRTSGWVEIRMAELSARRMEVRRERVGGQVAGGRGGNDVPADVAESLQRLRGVEKRSRGYQSQAVRDEEIKAKEEEELHEMDTTMEESEKEKAVWRNSRLVTRNEPELKTHTSYLVFAVLPRPWSEEDEAKAREKWGSTVVGEVEVDKKMGKKARKKAAKAEREGNAMAAIESVNTAMEQ